MLSSSLLSKSPVQTMLLPTVSLDLMKHETKTLFTHGSHGPLPLLKTSSLTCHLCRLLSSDPDDQLRLDMEVLKFRKQAYATSTKATYKSHLRAYLTFCVYYGYQPLPASTITLSCYAALLARSLSASSIPAYLNIVRILHLEHGLGDPTKNNFHLATTLHSIRHCKGHTETTHDPRNAFGYESHLNLADPVHATFWAVCLTGFFGLLPKANMFLKGVAKFNPLSILEEVTLCSTQAGPSLSTVGLKPSSLVNVSLLFHYL